MFASRIKVTPACTEPAQAHKKKDGVKCRQVRKRRCFPPPVTFAPPLSFLCKPHPRYREAARALARPVVKAPEQDDALRVRVRAFEPSQLAIRQRKRAPVARRQCTAANPRRAALPSALRQHARSRLTLAAWVA